MIGWEEETTVAHSAIMKKAIDTLGAVCLTILLALAIILFN